MNRATWNLAVAANTHLDVSHLDIARQPSRLRIETIDAFNAWLASQLPISAGAGASFQVLIDAGPIYQEAAAARWRMSRTMCSGSRWIGCWRSMISAGESWSN